MFGGCINEDFWGLVLWFNIIEDNIYNSELVNHHRHHGEKLILSDTYRRGIKLILLLQCTP